jgi:hypothetical protein
LYKKGLNIIFLIKQKNMDVELNLDIDSGSFVKSLYFFKLKIKNLRHLILSYKLVLT